MDIVIPVRPGDDNPELRIALRSIAANVPHDTVWLAGHCPGWVANAVRNIHVEQSAGEKWANARANRRAAVEHPQVAEQFYLWNDDFYVLRSIAAVPVMHRGPVNDVVEMQRGRIEGRTTRHIRGAIATAGWLRAQGVPHPLSYELHMPIPMTKTGLAMALDQAEQVGHEVPHIRTIYGNLHSPTVGFEVDDVKVRGLDQAIPADAVFASTADRTFADGIAGQQLRRLFPDPCIYEVA